MSDHSRDAELEQSTSKWMAVGLILIALFVLAFPVYRWYEPGQRSDAREEQKASLALQGAEIFGVSCSSCHGNAGRGGLAPALASKQFLDSVDDDQIVQLISLGVPGSEMVSYSLDNGGPLTAEQIRAVAVYLRSLGDDAVDNPSWRYPLAAEGLSAREMFLLGCSRCHGADLQGTDDGPDLGPGSDAEEENDSRLARQIREGGHGMPRFGGTLGEEQIQMLIDYIRQVQEG